MSTSDRTEDQSAIQDIVRTFLAAFESGPSAPARLTQLAALFLPEATIVRTCGNAPTVYDVEGFITPRRELLTSGALVDFSEWELRGRTDIFGDIAVYFGAYAKAGVQDGTPFTGRGMKSLHLVRTPGGWRISAAIWDDERDGVSIDPEWLIE
jgi:hypothetical protein